MKERQKFPFNESIFQGTSGLGPPALCCVVGAAIDPKSPRGKSFSSERCKSFIAFSTLFEEAERSFHCLYCLSFFVSLFLFNKTKSQQQYVGYWGKDTSSVFSCFRNA